MHTTRYSVGLRAALSRGTSVQVDGRDYIRVKDVVALVPGVIRALGSPAPEFISAERLVTFAPGWEGAPITPGHPLAADGTPLPAASSGRFLGRVERAYIDNDRLLMDLLLDAEACDRLDSARLLHRIMHGDAVEVSLGAQVAVSPATGTFNGKAYSGEWTALKPDHLALLERGIGACSVAMGCGVPRAASPYEPPDPWGPRKPPTPSSHPLAPPDPWVPRRPGPPPAVRIPCAPALERFQPPDPFAPKGQP